MTSNSTKYNLSNSFHGQNFLKNTIFSVLISGVKLLLIHSWFKKCWWIASYVFSILDSLVNFSLLLNPPMAIRGKTQTRGAGEEGGRGGGRGQGGRKGAGCWGLRIWNFQGYQGNSMWNFQGLIKNKMELPKGDQEKIMPKFQGSV